MNTCPACQKTHDEVKYYCDCCFKYYCSIECLKYQNFQEYDDCEVRKLTDWEFSCCGLCYCAKCHTWLNYDETDEIISVCDMCNRLFHDDCDSYIDNGSISCMCRLCVDLKNSWKKCICRSCHDKHDVEQLNFSNLYDVEKYMSFESFDSLDPKHIRTRTIFDFSDCKKFKKLREVLYQNSATSISFYAKNKGDSDNADQHGNNELSEQEISKNWEKILETFVINCLDCRHVDCDCKLCKNIKCNTFLFRLLFHDTNLNNDSNAWDMGNDFAPVVVLKSIAESPDNMCNCEICKFWKTYN